jgi:outer membrane protein TolC
VEQATRAYGIADVRYRAGVSTQLELADARLLLRQSEADRAQAARDLQIARVRLALLPELPIATGGGLRPNQPSVPAPVAPTPSQPAAPGGGTTRTAGTQAVAGGPGGRQ